VNVVSSERKILKKNFETEMLVDNQKLPLNHFVQETLANVLMGFLKGLKEIEEPPKTLEIRIRKLAKPKNVDAHTYP